MFTLLPVMNNVPPSNLLMLVVFPRNTALVSKSDLEITTSEPVKQIVPPLELESPSLNPVLL